MFAGVPLGWLDVVVALCGLVGVGFGVVTLLNEPGQVRGRYKFLSTVLFGCVFLLGGSDFLATRTIAPRFSLTGHIDALKNHGGKNPRCDIGLAGSNDSHAGLIGDFSCGQLYLGEHIKATWMTFNAHIVRIDILSGANTGSHLNDTGPFMAVIQIAIGLFLIYVAIRVRRRNPNAYPPKRTADDPPGGVDEESRLNLSGRK